MEPKTGVPVFSGWLRFRRRRNRKSYLFCFLIYFAISLAIELVFITYFVPLMLEENLSSSNVWIYFAIQFAIKFVYFVITAQRLRDFNLSGWFVLLLIPIAYFDQHVYGLATLAVTLFILVIPGTRGENRYGPDPIAALQPDSEEDLGPVARYEAARAKQQGQATVERPNLSDWKSPQNPQ